MSNSEANDDSYKSFYIVNDNHLRVNWKSDADGSSLDIVNNADELVISYGRSDGNLTFNLDDL